MASASARVDDDEALAVRPRRAAADAAVRGDGRQDAFRAIYGRGGAPCPRCGAPHLIRARGQGDDNRTTYWCPACQR